MMKKFYISSKEGFIYKYSYDFYQLVLKEKGYIFMNSAESFATIFSTISSKDHVHIEIRIAQKKEIEILFLMLKANYKSVSVTLHDAPLIKYPFHDFRNSFLNRLSKFYDKYISGFKAATPYIKKVKSIYVLSQKGLEAVKRKYRVEHVYYLPYIMDTAAIDEIRKKFKD
jgi:hypothetical protein